MSLSLHPRAVQQLFQVLLELDSEATPQTSGLSLPQRVNRLQTTYFKALHAAKYGILVQYQSSGGEAIEIQKGTLKIQDNGEMLVFEAVTEKSDQGRKCALSLASIESIVVCSSTQSFIINTDDAAGKVKARDSMAHKFTCQEDAAAIFNQWIVAVTYGANAFHQCDKRRQNPRAGFTSADLLWQAARLRIFELAECMDLSQAIAVVRHANEEFYQQNCGRGVKPPQLFLQLD